FDQAGVDTIFAETFPESGVGAAIMNRLAKAAGGRYL
ncbi:Sua5 family C-terminal domain-containing protein, partial [Acinetobacter baumannii]